MRIPFQLKHPAGALLLALTQPLMAQGDPQKNTDPVSHVIVSSGFMDKGYDVQNASSATRVSAPLIETPVSVDVVDQELIRDKAILSPGELANSVSGVQANGSIYGVGTSTNNFIVRGFSTNGINYRDGYRVNGIDTPTDMANVERVEFVKGPGSVLYGAAQPGGSVNTVTKKAVTDNFANVGVQAGSWSFLRSTLDMNQNFGDVSARINIAGDKGNSYIDLQSSSNYLVAPSVSWRINKDLEVSYSGEFQKVNLHGGYTGLPSIQGVQNLKAGTNMGQPWTSQSNTNSTNQADIKYKIDQDWTFRQGFFNANYWASYSPMITPSMFVSFQGTLSAANATQWNSTNASKNTSSQTELYGNVKTGDVSHKLMFGYEYAQTIYNWANQYNNLGNFGGIGPVNLLNPAYQAPASYPAIPNPPFNGGWTSTNTQKSNALYFQDQLAWGNWRLLAGIRNERVNSFDTFSSSQTETATTGRGGLLYMLTKATSVYYSISQSFTPNGSYRGTGGSILPSSRGLQNEVGVKHSIWEGLDATASLYQITRTNVPVSDGLGAYTVNGGEQSKGWEASLIGQATRSLRMIANASGINATTIQANTNYATGQLAPAGTPLAGVPKFSANIWGVQDLPLNMNGQTSVGLGVVYVGDRVANTPNTNGLIVPSYTTVDAGLFYKIDRINLALNVKNLTNSTVLSSAQGAFVLRQPGISYLATAGINF